MKTVGLTFPDAAPPVGPVSAEKFSCPHCGKEYKSKTALAKHIEEKHQEVASQAQ